MFLNFISGEREQSRNMAALASESLVCFFGGPGELGGNAGQCRLRADSPCCSYSLHRSTPRKILRIMQFAAAFELPKVPGLPSLTGPSADWRQFDSFFTFVVKRFGDDIPANLKDPLGDAFLDARYELTSAIAPGKGGNPVPELFVNGWKRLSPIMNQALPALPQRRRVSIRVS
jgi:hypothetical protein